MIKAYKLIYSTYDKEIQPNNIWIYIAPIFKDTDLPNIGSIFYIQPNHSQDNGPWEVINSFTYKKPSMLCNYFELQLRRIYIDESK